MQVRPCDVGGGFFCYRQSITIANPGTYVMNDTDVVDLGITWADPSNHDATVTTNLLAYFRGRLVKGESLFTELNTGPTGGGVIELRVYGVDSAGVDLFLCNTPSPGIQPCVVAGGGGFCTFDCDAVEYGSQPVERITQTRAPVPNAPNGFRLELVAVGNANPITITTGSALTVIG